MKTATIQMTSGRDIQTNLMTLLRRIEEAAATGARLIVAPEATSQAFGTGRLDSQAQDLHGPFATALRDAARDLGVYVVAGMFCPADTVHRDGKTIHRVDNTALITGPTVHTGYHKIHTFDAYDYRESDTVRPGAHPVTFEVDGIRCGVAICYDIRFPDHFISQAREGVQAFVIPTSWADGDDKLEAWRTLTQARALDATSYIIAAGQSRPGGRAQAGEASGPTGIGHSVIIDPYGRRLAEAGYEDELLTAEVIAGEVAAARRRLPVLGG